MTVSLPYSLEMVLGLFTVEIHCKLLFAIAAQRRIRRTADLLFAGFFSARDGASAVSKAGRTLLFSVLDLNLALGVHWCA